MDVVFRKRSDTREIPPFPVSYSDEFEVFMKKPPESSIPNKTRKLWLYGEVIHSFIASREELFEGHLIDELDIPEMMKWVIFRSLSEESRTVKRTRVMAIINATPDSFYKGSRFKGDLAAIDRILDSSPDIIDVGGESTRPGSSEISQEEEIERLTPVIDYISSSSKIRISLDTRHPKVLAKFADRISFANDITGFSSNEMIKTAAEFGLSCNVMHMRGTPETMNQMTEYSDLEYEIIRFLYERIGKILEFGIEQKNIIVDPGIGFAKNFSQNLMILRNARSFKFGYDLLIGASRKSFIGKIVDKDEEGRLSGSLAVAAWAALHGVDILRVHDPDETIQVLKVLNAIRELQ